MTPRLKLRCRPRAALKWLYYASGVISALCVIPQTAISRAYAQQNDSSLGAAIAGNARPAAAPKFNPKEGHAADDAFIAGARLLERNDRAGAEHEFERAVALAPNNPDYAMALSALREGDITDLVHRAGKARLLGHDVEAEQLLAEARKIDPNSSILLQHPVPGAISSPQKVHSWIVDGPRLAGPIELKPKAGVRSFHIHSTMQEVVRQVGTAYGLKVSLDTTVPSKPMKFDLEDVPYEQAMHILADMGSLLVVPLTPESIFVAKDNQETRQRYERQVQETIYAAGMTNEQLAELGNMIKSVFEVKQLSVENSFGTIVVRAPVETLRVLNLTLADMLDGGDEVMIDLKLYSVDKARTVNLGATVPNQAGAYNAASAATDLVNANQSIVTQAIAQGLIPAGTSNIEIAALLIQYGLATSSLLSDTLVFVGGGLTTTGVYASLNSTLNLALNSSDTRALDEIQLRVGDRQSATFRAGTKYPITQSTYSTSTPSATTSALAGATVNGVSVASLLNSINTSTVPQIQYEDLGVTLKATPNVQKSGMISLHLDLKIESLAGGTIDNIPILNNNSFTSDITVPDGQTAFLVSNMTKNQSAAVTGIPGLSDLPGFQSTPEKLRTTDVAQLLMVVTPHLVRKRANDAAGPRFPITMPATGLTD